MSDDKIRISWEDVHSPRVDTELKRAESVGRAQEHVQIQGERFREPEPTRSPGSVLRSSVVLMLLFGAVGGLLGWAGGEFVFLAMPSEFQDFQRFLMREADISQALQAGRITDAQAQERFQRLDAEARSNPYVAVGLDPALSDAMKRDRTEQMIKVDLMKEWIRNAAFYCMVGIILAVALAVAEPAGAGNLHGVAVNSAVGAGLGLVGAVIVCLFIDSLYRALGGGQTSSVQQIVARMIAWALLGLFVAVAPGIVLGNLKKFAIGLAGGLAGGLVGGLFFDPITMLTNSVVLGRLVGITSIGCLIGVGTGLIENAVKSGWLLVTHGLIAGKQFILYRNPTTIGSSPQCDIYLFKDTRVTPRHALVHAITGGFELEVSQPSAGTHVNGQAITRVRLRSGDVIQIGSTTFSFQERAKASK
jgi:FHA domain-containing protein